MKNLRYLFLIIAVCATHASASDGSNNIGKITFILGEVSLSQSGGDWETASFNSPVSRGDEIRTGVESRCEITLTDGSVIRLSENTLMSFENLKIELGKLQGDAKLSIGALWVNLKKLKSGDQGAAVKTPTSVMAVRGTVFRTEADDDSSTSVLVYEGAIDVKLSQELEAKVLSAERRKPSPPSEVKSPQKVHGPYEVTLREWKRIVAGMQINIRKDGKFHSFEFDSEKDAENEWVKWNRARDEISGR